MDGILPLRWVESLDMREKLSTKLSTVIKLTTPYATKDYGPVILQFTYRKQVLVNFILSMSWFIQTVILLNLDNVKAIVDKLECQVFKVFHYFP